MALNVALCGPGGKGWSFVEAPLAHSERHADQLRVGDSRLRRFDDGSLTIALDAPGTAFDRRMRGRITLWPERRAQAPAPRLLDEAGAHAWWPVLPNARVEVSFAAPHVQWRGRAYHDTNFGTEPLEKAFARWQWMRSLRRDHTEVAYVAEPSVGAARGFARAYAFDGSERELALPAAQSLPAAGWRLPRSSYGRARLERTLLNSPFYVRSRLRMRNGDVAMHETLDLRRWQRWWTQALLRFRLRRLP